ncbi:MAG: site-2 protease family protein [Oscillospiraceae bacterium]|jgi:Zn-dependent protease|nr:site-2 protease family protein [Oscillospiraceae bacterium]
MFDLLQSDPARFFDIALYRVPAVLIALILHECAHAYVAYRLGDPTAKELGRLTLNPARHLDIMGTILMIFAGFGWAKPVPIDPRNFKNPRRDDLLVSVAGVTVNLALFIALSILCVWIDRALWDERVFEQSTAMERLMFDGNILPYIMFGYADELSDWMLRPWLIPALRICAQLAMVNLYIAVFNLLPVPPLDGSHVLNDLILRRDLFASRLTASVGSVALLILSFSGLLGRAIGWLAGGVQRGLLMIIA